MLSMQYIYRYILARHMPLQGETTFTDISKAAGLGEKDVTRFLRVSISRHVPHEPRKGYVVHTAASRLLVDGPMLAAWITNIAEEFWRAVARFKSDGQLDEGV